LGSQIVTFTVLTVLATEPLTTYGLLSLLVMGLVLASTFAHSRPRASAAVIGGVVAALCLVKINVGAFAGAAVLFAWAQALPGHRRRWLAPLASGLAIAMPVALMTGLLASEWVLELAAVLAVAAAAVAVVWWSSKQTSLPPAPTGWLVAGGSIVAVGCLGVALVGGATPTDLWNGLIVAAVKFRGFSSCPGHICGQRCGQSSAWLPRPRLQGGLGGAAAAPGFGVTGSGWASDLASVLRQPARYFC
jgi:hypothetical protein